MKIGLFAGSFDPITNGHTDILEQALKIFDKIIIAVGCNSEKTAFLPLNKRVQIIQEAVKNFENVEVISYDGLTTDFARKNNVSALIRGLRNSSDFEYETVIEEVNSKLAPEIPTVYLTAKPENRFISSSIVRELINNKADISKFAPKELIKYLQ